MKRIGLSLGVVVSLGLPSCLRAQTPRDTAEAREVVRSFYDVLNSHRLERAVAYTADDCHTIKPDGRRTRGRDAALKESATPHATFLKDVTLTVDEMDIRFAAATAAIVAVTSPPSVLTAALSGRYDVQRELGHGGMPTVYLARDTKHGRLVAIKCSTPTSPAPSVPRASSARSTSWRSSSHPHPPGRYRQPAAVAGTVIVGAFVFLGMASVGLFFLPSAVGLIALAQAVEPSSRPAA